MQELALAQPGGIFGRPAATSEERSEAEASSASRAESRAHFEALLAECGPLAFRIARGVLHNTADAEDVAQETMLRAYRRFDRLRDRARFRGWIVRIAFRIALDRTRSAKRREMRETRWFDSLPRRSSADAALSHELQSRLDAALDEISPKCRIVLLLSAIEGHTIEEVAGMLGVPIGTVKSRLFTGRKQLAEKLRCYVNTKGPR